MADKKKKPKNYNTQAKQDTLRSISDEQINRMSSKDLVKIGKQGLKMLKQQLDRLKKGGYDESKVYKRFEREMQAQMRVNQKTLKEQGHDIKNTDNIKSSLILNKDLSRGRLLHNVMEIKNQLLYEDNTVAGRIENERKAMGWFKNYMNLGLATDLNKSEYFNYSRITKGENKGGYRYRQGTETGVITKQELKDFWEAYDALATDARAILAKYPEFMQEIVRDYLSKKNEFKSVHQITARIQEIFDSYYVKQNT